MLYAEVLSRQRKLTNMLQILAGSLKDRSELQSIAGELQTIYTDGFRHKYAEFFPLIIEFANSEDLDLEFLSTNLEELRSFIEDNHTNGDKSFSSLHYPFTKLSEHINLEIARYNYYCRNEEKLSELEARNDALRFELRDTTRTLRAAEKKVSSVQTELIAVLSIFAAIVLAFSGSMSFLGNALTAMGTTPFFKATFFVLLCGFIILNTIFMMLYIVAKITGRSIYANCNSENCTCNSGKPKCRGISRIRKRLPYIFWVNAVILLLIVLVLILWSCGVNLS